MRPRFALFGLFLLLVACDGGTADAPLPVFEVEVTGGDGPEYFRIALATPQQVAEAATALASQRVGVVHGTVRRGDGGFNTGYTWHLDPASITFPDAAIELCDGRPRSDVEADVDYWVGTVQAYCPWGARLVRRVR